MRGLCSKIKDGEPLKFAIVEKFFQGRWYKYPLDRLYYLTGFVKVTDFETDETLIFKMPERTVYRKGVYNQPD